MDWTGGTNTSWDTPSNWSPEGVPGASDIARWDSSSYTRNLDTGGADGNIRQYLFTANNTGGATIGGSSKVLITGVSDGSKYIGILVESGSGAATVGKPLALTNAQSWINNSSNLLKISNYWKIDADLTIEGSGTGGVNFNGNYESDGGSGSGGLIVNLPNGVVTIWSELAGRFAGQTIVKQGILSLGSINNYNTPGTLGYNAWPVILGDNGTTGTLKYTGGTVLRDRGFTLAGGGTGAFQVDEAESILTLTGLIDGAGDLTKTGAGTLSLSGNNTYTGETIIMAGTLIIGNGGGGSSDLADASTVKISVDAKMNLSFSGEDQIAELWLGGAKMAPGTYSSINTPIDYRSYFEGTGSLLVVPGVLLGDANGDGLVDAADYIWLKQHFGETTALGQDGDFNNSGQVDWADLQTLMSALNVGSEAPATTPEPCSAMLLMFGAAALLRRRQG